MNPIENTVVHRFCQVNFWSLKRWQNWGTTVQYSKYNRLINFIMVIISIYN